ncbi:MAG: PilZ domain-containing protein [Polyangiaceae bacterium]
MSGAKSDHEQSLGDALLKALEGIDHRRSATVRTSPTGGAPRTRGEDVPDSGRVWEKEPDTQRFVAAHDSAVVRPSTDRRLAKRVRLEVPVVITTGGTTIDGTSEDISMTGLFVQTARLLHSGKRVKVRFDLPAGTLDVTAVVVRFRTPSRNEPAGVGLCFHALSKEQEESIEAYCAE